MNAQWNIKHSSLALQVNYNKNQAGFSAGDDKGQCFLQIRCNLLFLSLHYEEMGISRLRLKIGFRPVNICINHAILQKQGGSLSSQQSDGYSQIWFTILMTTDKTVGVIITFQKCQKMIYVTTVEHRYVTLSSNLYSANFRSVGT